MKMLMMIALLAAAMPAWAADTYTVPVTAVPGSVTGTVSGIPLPTSLPFSAPIFVSGACSTTGTLSAEIVNGALEVELDLTANGSNCGASEVLVLMLEMVAPELGGTVTMVRLNPVPLVADFPVLAQAEGNYNGLSSVGSTTTSVEGAFSAEFGNATWTWNPGLDDYPSPPVDPRRLVPLIPGDTVQFPLRVRLGMSDPSSFVGTLRMRYEYRVTVPEPSAALSLPIGLLTLASLSMLKGGA